MFPAATASDISLSGQNLFLVLVHERLPGHAEADESPSSPAKQLGLELISTRPTAHYDEREDHDDHEGSMLQGKTFEGFVSFEFS